MRYSWRQRTGVVALALFLVQLTYCSSTKRVAVPPRTPTNEKIVAITTVGGTVVDFDEPGAVLRNDTLYARTAGAPFQIPVDSVQHAWIMRRSGPSALMVIGIAAGVIVIAGAIAMATKQSCPFVYSWDGSRYVFDAEPYGGAVTRGLERDDYGALEHLRPSNGQYRLMLTNEVNESQYTNLVELLVVDHPAGTRVVPDDHGGMHLVTTAEPPATARNAAGRDLSRWLTASDRKIWEPPPDGAQDDVVLAFAKPRGSRSMKLVSDAATSLWGSTMIREMLMLRGAEVAQWYDSVDAGGQAALAALAWGLGEHLYAMPIEVEEPDGWHVRGVLAGGGPFIAEQRVTVLDVSRVAGDTVRIRLQPPNGFWALNSFAADFTPDEPVHVDTLRARAAYVPGSGSVLGALQATDDRYFAMPNTGDRAFLTFDAPPARDGLERSVFVHARGYYQLHLPEGGAPDVATLRAVLDEPGGAARFAAQRFARRRVTGTAPPHQDR